MLLHHFGFFEREIINFFLILSHRAEILPIILSLKFHVKFWFHIKSAAQDNFSNFHTVFFLSSSQISSSSNWFFQLFLNTSLYYVLCGFFLRGEKFCLLSNIFAFFSAKYRSPDSFLYTFISFFKFLRHSNHYITLCSSPFFDLLSSSPLVVSIFALFFLKGALNLKARCVFFL